MRGQAWFFGAWFLFFAVIFYFGLSPVMYNFISNATGLPSSQVALGGLMPVFLLVGIGFVFWKIIAPGAS